MSEGWLPALRTLIITVAVWPVATFPKFTVLGEATNLVTGARPVPVSDTVTLAPWVPVMVIEPVVGPAFVGAKVKSTGIDWPGLITVPTAGGLTAANGLAGSLMEVIRTGLVLLLAMTFTS